MKPLDLTPKLLTVAVMQAIAEMNMGRVARQFELRITAGRGLALVGNLGRR